MSKKNPIRYWSAPEVQEIAETLLDFHPHLHGESIRYIFRSEAAEAKMKVVLGKARRVSGLTAYLANAEACDGIEPPYFYLVEIAHDTWQRLTVSQRIALVDHELSHIGPDGMVSHDVEEFSSVVQRHGLWKPDLRDLAKSMAATPLFEAVEAMRPKKGSGIDSLTISDENGNSVTLHAEDVH